MATSVGLNSEGSSDHLVRKGMANNPPNAGTLTRRRKQDQIRPKCIGMHWSASD